MSVETSIEAPIAVVWRFLTVGRGAWWPEMHFDAVVGSPLIETWIDEGRQASATGSVTRCEEPELLGFSWIEPSWAHPLDVMIRLDEDWQSTLVTLTEAGFSRGQTPSSLPAKHEEGWRYHLMRLKRANEGEPVDVQ